MIPSTAATESRRSPALAPSPVERWHGPMPTDTQKLLFAACLEPSAGALAAWHTWLARGRFEQESTASIELAALAVARLGAAAGDGIEATRCRGWNRRAWLVSELAITAARRIDAACRRRGLPALACGDLATWGAGPTFAGRRFPVRSINILVPGVGRDDLAALRDAALTGPGGETVRTGAVPLRLIAADRPGTPWQGPPMETGAWEIAYPGDAEHVAWLIRHNWRRRAPGRLRWVLEALSILERAEDPELVAARVVAAADRDDTMATLREALDWLASLSDLPILAPIRAAAARSPVSLRSRLRLLITARLPPTALALLLRARERWQRPAARMVAPFSASPESGAASSLAFPARLRHPSAVSATDSQEDGVGPGDAPPDR